MKETKKIKKNSWYHINYPGDDIHPSYYGKAKCMSGKEKDRETYVFEYIDKDYGKIFAVVHRKNITERIKIK